MEAYLQLLRHLLEVGLPRSDRTGVGTRSLFGYQMRLDLEKGFPLLTTKKLHFKSIIHELIWFLRGETNIAYLRANNVHIWDEWADSQGELGPIYGKQWRRWDGDNQTYDQIEWLIEEIRANPHSRRLVVSAWNVADLPQMALPPCHTLFQFYVSEGKLSCQLYQRSADVFLGLPYNIASYAALTHMIAQITGLRPGELIHTLGDVHLYLSHLEQATLQLTREPRPLPQLILRPRQALEEFLYEDFSLVGYDPHPAIKATVAV